MAELETKSKEQPAAHLGTNQVFGFWKNTVISTFSANAVMLRDGDEKRGGKRNIVLQNMQKSPNQETSSIFKLEGY